MTEQFNNKGIPRYTIVEGVCCHQTCPTGNTHGIPSDLSEGTLDSTSKPQGEIKVSDKGKTMGKYKNQHYIFGYDSTLYLL